MTKQVLSIGLATLCLMGSAQAAPDLSAAYAKPVWMASAAVVRTELAQDEWEKPEEDTTYGRDDFTAPSSGEAVSTQAARDAQPASPQEMARMRDAYDRGLRLHRVGNITTLVGGIAVVPLSLGIIASAWSGNGGLTAVLGVGVVGAVGAYYTGGFLSSLGAFNSTRAMNAAFGTDVSTGFAIGGMVSSTAGVLLTPFGLGAFAPIVGIILGSVQIRNVKRALDDLGVADFEIAPTPQGFALSLRF